MYYKLSQEFLLENYLVANAYSRTCSTEDSLQSVQSLFHSYFTLLIAAELKIFSSLSIAFEVLISEESIDDYYSISTMYSHRVNYLNTELKKITGVFRTIMMDASRNVWKCDPKTHEEDNTYIKLKHLFQVVLRAPRDIEESGPRTYKDTCGDPKILSYETRNELCPYRKCAGPLYDCEENYPIDLYDTVNICFSKEQTDRGYDYVESVKKSVIFGSDEHFHYGLKKPRECKTHANLELDFFKLKLSYCTCDDNVYDNKTGRISDRRFYLGAAMADVSNNYVVTGARIRKDEEHGIIYIQIQHGKLLPGGNVNSSTLEWRTIPKDELMNSVYHYELNWSDRDIELQDIDIPHGHALTGIQFNKMTKNGKNRLGLKALHQTFNFRSGFLAFRKSMKEVDATAGKISTDRFTTNGLKLPNTLSNDIIKSDQHLRFDKSDYVSDFGQTTVPFIDIQDVTTKKSFPMSGVGLFYKKSQDDRTAGFVALKLKTYDFSKHLPRI